jgi:hypothetical protein
VKFSVLGEKASRCFLFSLQALSLARKAGEMNNEFLLLLFWALFIFAPRRVEKAEKALSFRRRSQLAG